MTDLAAACARLRAALDLPPGAARMCRGDLAAVLRAAEGAARLKSYAVHAADCEHHRPRPYGVLTVPGRCTCGLQDVVEGRFPGEAGDGEWASTRVG